jgi:hypothetical protein
MSLIAREEELPSFLLDLADLADLLLETGLGLESLSLICFFYYYASYFFFFSIASMSTAR